MNTNLSNYTTWEETMQAIVEGDISLDEGRQLATKCAEIADRTPKTSRSIRKQSAKKKGDTVRQMQYCLTMPECLEQLRLNDVSPIEDIERIKKTLIECGKAADKVESKEIAGASV